jgi:prevent-host-death family protein
MRIASVADVKTHLSAYLEESKTNGPVIITRNGKAVAVLVTPEDDDDLERILMARSPQMKAIVEKSRRSLQAGQGLSEEAFWKAVDRRGKEKGKGPA